MYILLHVIYVCHYRPFLASFPNFRGGLRCKLVNFNVNNLVFKFGEQLT